MAEPDAAADDLAHLPALGAHLRRLAEVYRSLCPGRQTIDGEHETTYEFAEPANGCEREELVATRCAILRRIRSVCGHDEAEE